MRHKRHRRKVKGVPRGMLLPITLRLLKEKPMSGSEIVDLIEYYADWKPSPGSIYPLLGRLEEQGLIKPSKKDDVNLKRFELTEKGFEELEAHREHDKEIRKRSSNMRRIYWRLFRNMPEDVYDSFIGLLDSIEEAYDSINDLDQLRLILDETISKIERLEKRENE